jgi:hypothetical protein
MCLCVVFEKQQKDRVAVSYVDASHSRRVPLADVLSRGSRCISLQLAPYSSDVLEIVTALSRNHWIRVADFKSHVRFGSLGSENMHSGMQASVNVRCLTSMLRSNTSITELHLPGLQMSFDEVREVVSALQYNSSIETLHLIDFDVSEAAGDVLMDLLRQVDDSCVRRHSSVIKSITFRGVGGGGGDGGGEQAGQGTGLVPLTALCAALRCNTTLTSIDLQTYGFDSDVSAELVDALEHNQHITSFKISKDVFEGFDDIAASIDRILKARLLASRTGFA